MPFPHRTINAKIGILKQALRLPYQKATSRVGVKRAYQMQEKPRSMYVAEMNYQQRSVKLVNCTHPKVCFFGLEFQQNMSM